MYWPHPGMAYAAALPGMHSSLAGAAFAVAPIDTLMISNLSAQASEVELKAVTSGLAGYKRLKLVNTSKGCTAWVQFEDVPSADAAMRALQGSSTLALDAQGLRVAYSKNPMGAPGRAAVAPSVIVPVASQDFLFSGKRLREDADETCAASPRMRLTLPHHPHVTHRGFHPAAQAAIHSGTMYSMYTPPFALPMSGAWQLSPHGQLPVPLAPYAASSLYSAAAYSSSTTCSPIDTLMISNISQCANNDDLNTVMNGFAGYKRLKLVNTSKGCTAWVQFEDVPSADAAMRALQGSSTLALDAQGLRITYSKKPMVADSGSSSLPPRADAPTASRGSPAIDTLMISNLSAQASEGELEAVTSGLAGYKRLKLVNTSKGCTAWVQFEDVPSADAAMRALQGSSTLALDAQGLRVAYSKSPMGVITRLLWV